MVFDEIIYVNGSPMEGNDVGWEPRTWQYCSLSQWLPILGVP